MRNRRWLFIASFLALLSAISVVACVGGASSSSSGTRSQEQYSAEVTKGAWLYVEYGCVQCHGLGGRGRDLVPTSGPSLVSAEFKKAFPKESSYDAALVAQIRNGIIVENGRTASMPAWNGILSDEQLNSIVAYIRAGLPDLGVPIRQAKTGADVYEAFACVKCHGPLGTGGFGNVGATTPEHKTIPAVGGPDFRKKFGARENARNFILNGSLVEGGRSGVVYMPAWGNIGTADQIEKVVDYIWDYANP